MFLCKNSGHSTPLVSMCSLLQLTIAPAAEKRCSVLVWAGGKQDWVQLGSLCAPPGQSFQERERRLAFKWLATTCAAEQPDFRFVSEGKFWNAHHTAESSGISGRHAWTVSGLVVFCKLFGCSRRQAHCLADGAGVLMLGNLVLILFKRPKATRLV